MRFLNPIKISLKNILSSKWRSFLTILGIIIGVASVIVVMAIGSSAQALIIDQITGIGSNLIGILPGGSEEEGPPSAALGVITTTLTYDDLKAITNKNNAPHITDANGYVTGAGTVQYRSNSIQSNFQGVLASFVSVENVTLANGRFFTSDESISLARVAVLGSKRSDGLFPNEDPIGKTISVKDLNFTVIGVLEERGSVGFSNTDNLVYVPLFTAQKQLLGINYLNFVRAAVDKPENIDQSIEDVKTVLRKRHDIRDASGDDFTVRASAQAVESLTKITNVLKYFLVSIAAISLLVGGVGIMNIMLISVQQRIREVGLRKAVGAQNSNIISQFLVESVFITLIGGVMGIVLGVGMAFAAAIIIRALGYSWEFIVTIQSIILAVSVSAGIGIIFGLYPARRASKISPMEALRYE